MPHLFLVGGGDESRRSSAADSVVERFELVVRTGRKLGQFELVRKDCTPGAIIDHEGANLRVIELVRSDHPGELAILVVELV